MLLQLILFCRCQRVQLMMWEWLKVSLGSLLMLNYCMFLGVWLEVWCVVICVVILFCCRSVQYMIDMMWVGEWLIVLKVQSCFRQLGERLVVLVSVCVVVLMGDLVVVSYLFGSVYWLVQGFCVCRIRGRVRIVFLFLFWCSVRIMVDIVIWILLF